MTLPAALERETGYQASQPLGPYWLTGGPVKYAPEDSGEYVPELAYPASITVFSRMRNDAKVQEVLRAIGLPILGARRHLDPNGARPQVVAQIAEDLGVPVLGQADEQPGGRTRDRFSLGEHLRLALLSLVFGHMPFEQLYRIVEEGGRPYARLRKLAPRMPQTLEEILVERDGGLVGIRQLPPGQVQAGQWVGQQVRWPGQEPLIPVDRLVMYVHDREGAAWQGRSLLRSAYRPWKLKDEALRVWLMSLRRNGIGSPVYHGAPNETDEQIAKGAKLAQSLRAGETAGAGVPNGANITMEGVRGSLPDHKEFVRYQDEEIAGSVLAEFLKLGSSESGSRALGETFVDFFTLADQAVADLLVETVNEHVVEDLVDLNWGPDEPAPRLVLEDVGSDHRLTAQAIEGLVSSGALKAEPALEDYLRRYYRLPNRAPAAGTPAAAGRPRSTRPSATVAASTGRRAPTAVEVTAAADFDAIDAAWSTRLDQLLATWKGSVRAAQVEDLVEQTRAVAAAGDVAAVAGLTAPAGLGVALLEQAMLDMATEATAEAVREAARQGVLIDVPSTTELTAAVRPRAEAVDDLLASGLSNAAKRATLVRLGDGSAVEDVAAGVAEQLAGLVDTYLVDHLGGALTAAQNHARFTVMAAAPVTHVYASELLDSATCSACAAVDGRQFATVGEGARLYPTGGYRDCEGGSRCRGTLVAVYAVEAPPSIEQVA